MKKEARILNCVFFARGFNTVLVDGTRNDENFMPTGGDTLRPIPANAGLGACIRKARVSG